jgi:putative endonuclease
MIDRPSPNPSRKREGRSDRRAADQRGRDGEAQAAAWLERQGWTILATRVRTPAGEVDLVARRPGIVAFIEVKVRATAAGLDFAIDERRLSRVAAAAEILADRFMAAGDDMRVDVLLIAPGLPPRVIENAWIG